MFLYCLLLNPLFEQRFVPPRPLFFIALKKIGYSILTSQNGKNTSKPTNLCLVIMIFKECQ